MRVVTSISIAAALAVSACSQFTTNDSERSVLRDAADQQAELYLSCIGREVQQYSAQSTDAAFVLDVVSGRCEAELDVFRVSATEYYSTKVMMAEKPVLAEVEDLQRRAKSVISERMVNNSRAAAVPAAAAVGAVAATPPPSLSGDWQADQRVYLDCMLEQARRYSSLEESAGTIAEVAQNTCAGYLGGENAAGLMQEGRALVLKEVFDSRVGRRPGN